MNHDHTHRDLPRSAASEDLSAEDETGEPRLEGESRTTEILDEADDEAEFSLVDPLLYAPLLLVGTALVVIPEPVTTLLGLGCVALGVGLAVADVCSPSGSIP